MLNFKKVLKVERIPLLSQLLTRVVGYSRTSVGTPSVFFNLLNNNLVRTLLGRRPVLSNESDICCDV